MLTELKGAAGRFFLPLAELFAPALGFSSEVFQRAFIRLNNDLILKRCKSFAPERILMLIPHCLQRVECRLRLTHAVDRCERCGSCSISGLLALRDAYGTNIAIASGGTLARRIVLEKKPDFILAVACERDLVSGVRDTHPLPVFCILNDRPQGPCINTSLPLEMMEKALRRFIVREKLPSHPLFPLLAAGDSRV
ncbi:MAG: DUF116 domain-containing protein [Desulfovibrio sp.]|jgi:hypothetical protein|nr:DUF116 domain-containing protein [Desulfovibrio sp.]